MGIHSRLERKNFGDRRESARNPAHVPVRFSGSNGAGKGVLSDVSYAGARIDECSWVPPAGSEARIVLEVPGIGFITIQGTVQWHEGASFALSCNVEGFSDRERIDRLTALLFASGTDRRKD